MMLSSRSQVVAENVRGYGYEYQLFLDGLEGVLSYSDTTLPGAMQTPAYTAAVLGDLGARGLTHKPEMQVGEESKRSLRNNALLGDPTVQVTLVVSRLALRMVVGNSEEATASGLRKALEITQASIDNPKLRVAFFDPEAIMQRDDGLVRYEPALAISTTHQQIKSREHGNVTWLGDSTVEAPADSCPALVYPRAVQYILAHETTVTDAAAIPVVERALQVMEAAAR